MEQNRENGAERKGTSPSAQLSLEFPQISIAWRDVHYAVPVLDALTPKRKVLLSGLSGHCTLASLTGLMGPSGAGKTTLLRLLCGLSSASSLSSSSRLYVNASLPVSAFFIEQHVEENIITQMRVQTLLRYAFAFKNGTVQYTAKERDAHIHQILAQLLLDESILRRTFGECSGGEQKRLAICQELMSLTVPSFLFLDEPTTGLDSAAAYQVIKCLANLATHHRITVIASIHVPNSETLALFDSLYVLARGGTCLYSGPPDGIEEYLKGNFSSSSSQASAVDQPPIERLIKYACTGERQPSDTAHRFGNVNVSHLKPIPSGVSNTRKCFHLSDLLLLTSRFCRVTFLTNGRATLSLLAAYLLFIALLRTFFDASMVLTSGCVSRANDSATTCLGNLQENSLLRENINYHACILLYAGLVISGSSAIWYASSVKVFRSEHRNGWYSLGVFYWASLLASLLEMTLTSVLIGTFAYFLPASHSIDGYTLNWSRLGLYCLFIWLFALFMQSFGQLVGALLLEYVNLAVILCLLSDCSMLLLNGIFIDIERNEYALIRGASNLLAVKYVSYGLMYALYAFERCDFSLEKSIIVQFFLLDLSAIPEYVYRLVINILLMRLFTFAVLFIKLGPFQGKLASRRWTVKKGSAQVQSPLKLDPSEVDTLPALRQLKKEDVPKGDASQILFAWRNVSLFGESSIYANDPSTCKVPILRQVNGHLASRTLTALMGPSGAGKTSLLKVINGKFSSQLSEATEMYLSRRVKLRPCFVSQNVSSHLMPGLTARQLLFYASKLKNAQCTTADHQAIVGGLLLEFTLDDAAETKVEHCSGGERKRLALAAELTATLMPNLLCIDEPTSGLDSTATEAILALLHRLTRHYPLAIVTSIHQPPVDALSHFDQLYVLAKGGVCLYSGAPSGIQAHLSRLPPVMGEGASHRFPIEALIRLSCSAWNSPIVSELSRLNNTTNGVASSSKLQTDTILVIDGIPPAQSRFSLASSAVLFRRYWATFAGHHWFEWLFFAGNYLSYALLLRLFFDSKIIHISGCVDPFEEDLSTGSCNRSGESTEELIHLVDNFKYNYFYTIFYLFFVLIQFSLNFANEFKFLKSEHQNGWYSSGSYYLMKSLLDVLLLLPVFLLYVYIGDWIESIRPGVYAHLLLVFFLASCAIQSMAHLLALLSYGYTKALIYLGVILFVIATQLSNFMLPHGRLHYAHALLSNFFPGRFMFEAVMLLQYGFGRCRPQEIHQLLYTMGLTDGDYTRCLLMLLFHILFYRALALYLLVRRLTPLSNRKERIKRIVTFREKMMRLV